MQSQFLGVIKGDREIMYLPTLGGYRCQIVSNRISVLATNQFQNRCLNLSDGFSLVRKNQGIVIEPAL